MLLTILMPCLNEEKSLKYCIDKAKLFLSSNNIDGEILVVDNNSTDSSASIAIREGARLVKEVSRGYGCALKTGIKEARGNYIIMADCDGSYDFEHLELILDKLLDGYDFVCGNRFKGGICKDAMPLSHKFGAPFLSFIAKMRYNVPLNDFHCGLRGFNTQLAQSFDYSSTGMEFATELIYKFRGTRMTEVPVVLYKDLRNDKSHLRTVRDGLRHLKFIVVS